MTRTIGVPGTGIFYMSRAGTQTGMHSATPPADPLATRRSMQLALWRSALSGTRAVKDSRPLFR